MSGGGQEAKAKVECKVTNVDGWTWKGDEQANGWWKANTWQSSGQWMSANGETAWEPEEKNWWNFLRSTASKDATARAPEGDTEQRVRWWQRPRREERARDQEVTYSSPTTVEMGAQTKKRQTVISPTPTERRVVVLPEIPHDTRTCIEDLDFDESDSDELREEREDARRSWTLE